MSDTWLSLESSAHIFIPEMSRGHVSHVFSTQITGCEQEKCASGQREVTHSPRLFKETL